MTKILPSFSGKSISSSFLGEIRIRFFSKFVRRRPERQTIQPVRRKHSRGPWHPRCGTKRMGLEKLQGSLHPKNDFLMNQYDDRPFTSPKKKNI